MIAPLSGPVLTAQAMREAENDAIAAGTEVNELMERAGRAVADIAHRVAAGASVLVVAGPGNNGGDGYLAARILQERGLDVRIAIIADPASDAAKHAASRWTGPVETLGPDTRPAAIVIDAGFGTGLGRALADDLADDIARLTKAARRTIAVDLPSGIDSDSGLILNAGARADITIALGAAKPAHMLLPSAAACGMIRVAPIGIDAASEWVVLDRPTITAPASDAHKYSRGMVAVVGGSMAGAALLACQAAFGSGAGYVAFYGGKTPGGPHALVRRPCTSEALSDDRIGAIAIGCGLGRDDRARERLDLALATDSPLVIDGDALALLGGKGLHRLSARNRPAILTPHTGEFDCLFGTGEDNKIERTITAAKQNGCVVVHKGADTVIAAPDGRVRISPLASPWLSVAGTGDVLAGVIAARLADCSDPFSGACEGVWLHSAAARTAGGGFTADALCHHLPVSLEQCL